MFFFFSWQGLVDMKDCCTQGRKHFWIAATCCVLIPLAPILHYLVNGGLLSSRSGSETARSSEIDLRQWMGQLPPHLTSRLGSYILKHSQTLEKIY